MTKLAKLTVISAVALLSGLTQTQAANTNVVQHVTFALTYLEQGPTNHPSTNITVHKAIKVQVTTKDIIQALCAATTNTFVKGDSLVRVININATTNETTFEIRNGTNTAIDVTGFFTLSHSTNSVDAYSTDSATGITSGVTTDITFLTLANVPPYNLLANFKLGGLTATTHTSIKDGKSVIGVDEVSAVVAGTGADTNGMPAVISGTVNVNASVSENK
jgi:hypothetical protein